MTDTISLEPNPFRHPIYSEKGDYDSPSLARIKGYALSQWEHAENLICTMFSLLVRPTGGTHVAHRAIGSLFSSGGRRELVLGAADAYFALLTHQAPDSIKQNGEQLHSKIRSHIRMFGEAAHRRDEIAHGVVMGPEWDGKRTLFYLMPAMYASKKHDPEFQLGFSNPTYRMNFAAIDRMASLFDLLYTRTAELNRQISQFYQSLPEELRKRHP